MPNASAVREIAPKLEGSERFSSAMYLPFLSISVEFSLILATGKSLIMLVRAGSEEW